MSTGKRIRCQAHASCGLAAGNVARPHHVATRIRSIGLGLAGGFASRRAPSMVAPSPADGAFSSVLSPAWTVGKPSTARTSTLVQSLPPGLRTMPKMTIVPVAAHTPLAPALFA